MDEDRRGGNATDTICHCAKRCAAQMSSIRISPSYPKGEHSTLVFEHGTLTVKLYAPRGTDPQQPHTRDEGYVVISGRGTFVHGHRRDPFEPNDFLFAPAGLSHRFENFTDDLLVWVIFYGPEGGEVRNE